MSKHAASGVEALSSAECDAVRPRQGLLPSATPPDSISNHLQHVDHRLLGIDPNPFIEVLKDRRFPVFVRQMVFIIQTDV
jgi:hypothetical protein